MFGVKGFRSLGLGSGEGEVWEFLGVGFRGQGALKVTRNMGSIVAGIFSGSTKATFFGGCP